MEGIESMIDWFLEMDKNEDGLVDRKELQQFYESKNLPQNQIDTANRIKMNWLTILLHIPLVPKEFINRFDTNDDNKITMAEFCRGLGLRMDEITNERKQRKQDRENAGKPLSGAIQIVSTTMSSQKQYDITEKFMDLCKTHGTDSNGMKVVAKEFKAFLDNQYGRVWQCVVLTGSYWMHFSHEPFLSIQFKYDKYICLAWRTPQC
ncbi:hypothetical protein CRM22_004072 [Opisthorchis felineus]|uniref:EF-hand domain-containing protein n=1 Tax=Opisthorchis felineus TaxID=147828 RepID=A0A4S2M489_OPIFE|nr:hypothetical protein CRM22_004072 [Opisthorchis felineus]